jgi:predicted nucleic acid-binding protein
VRIIIDTNIIFSALVNSNGKIGELIFNSKKTFEFYGCEFLKTEITHHWEKLRSASKLSDHELTIAKDKLYQQIFFINQQVLNQETLLKAEKIVKDIDPDDTFFVALTLSLNGGLWTGDKNLYKGLKEKKFKEIYNTHDLWEKRKELENRD